MCELDDLRKKIELADEKIAELFEKRMLYVKDIALYKSQHDIQVFDREREEYLIKKNSGIVSDEVIRSYYVKYLINLMDISKEYQSRVISENQTVNGFSKGEL